MTRSDLFQSGEGYNSPYALLYSHDYIKRRVTVSYCQWIPNSVQGAYLRIDFIPKKLNCKEKVSLLSIETPSNNKHRWAVHPLIFRVSLQLWVD